MVTLTEFFTQKVKDKTVVDLGCAGYDSDYGEREEILTKVARQWYGGDINKEFIEENSIKNKNLFYCDLNELTFFSKFPSRPDVICLMEVIEHLQSPFKTIKYICDNKSSDTALLVSVPNGMSFGKVLYGLFSKKKLLKQDIYHYYLFNERTLSNLFKDAGLSKFKIIPYTRTKGMKRVLQFIPNFASGFIVYGN